MTLVHDVVRTLTVTCVAGLLFSQPTHAHAQPNPPRAQLTEELRLDAAREDFARVGRVYVGPAGEIAVPDWADMTIRRYSASGTRLASVGKKGQGPGEFASITRLGWHGDSMWVSDASLRRVSWFTADGTLIRTVANPPLSERPVSGTQRVLHVTPTYVMSDGALAGTAYLAPLGASTRRISSSAFVRVSSTGDVRVMAYLSQYDADERFFMSYAGLSNPIPFVVTPTYVVSSDAAYLARLQPLQTSAEGGTVNVTLIRSAGGAVYNTTFPYRGEPIPKAVRDSAIAAELSGEVTEGPSNLRQQFHAIAKRKTPHIYPGATFIVLGLDNTVWVGVNPTPDGQKVLMLGQPKGVAVFHVILPKGTTLRQATAQHIWVTETDDDGLNSVVRYRVTGVP